MKIKFVGNSIYFILYIIIFLYSTSDITPKKTTNNGSKNQNIKGNIKKTKI